MKAELSTKEMASVEIHRLTRALEALINHVCCRGAGTSLFQVMGRDGKATGEEVRLCDRCGRELPLT